MGTSFMIVVCGHASPPCSVMAVNLCVHIHVQVIGHIGMTLGVIPQEMSILFGGTVANSLT